MTKTKEVIHMANKKKEVKIFRIKRWMLVLTVLFPIAGIGFMAADLHGQKKARKIAEKHDAEIEAEIKKAKKETENDEVDKESDEES